MEAPDPPYGTELVLDLAGCTPAAIRSRPRLVAYAGELCDLIGMKPYGEPLVERFGLASPATAGYTLVQLIETSSITGHFSEATNRAYLNIFSCLPFEADAAAEFSRSWFGAATAEQRLLVRR